MLRWLITTQLWLSPKTRCLWRLVSILIEKLGLYLIRSWTVWTEVIMGDWHRCMFWRRASRSVPMIPKLHPTESDFWKSPFLVVWVKTNQPVCVNDRLTEQSQVVERLTFIEIIEGWDYIIPKLSNWPDSHLIYRIPQKPIYKLYNMNNISFIWPKS